MSARHPIGVFDSGIGGLTVLKELIRELPAEDFVYFGDTARVPYGTKSRDTIIKFSLENIEFLLGFKVKLIVIACNTSSAWALATLKQYFKVPIVGVIRPGAEAAVEASRTKRIGVIGTHSTILSQAYNHAIAQLNGRAQIVSQSCPLFVSLVEEGWIGDPVCRTVVHRYLDPLLKRKIDTLLLGCTHYPLLAPMIRRVTGPQVAIVDAARRTALNVRSVLEQDELLVQQPRLPARQAGHGQVRFTVSDEPERFARVGERFLGQPIRHVKLGGP